MELKRPSELMKLKELRDHIDAKAQCYEEGCDPTQTTVQVMDENGVMWEVVVPVVPKLSLWSRFVGLLRG